VGWDRLFVLISCEPDDACVTSNSHDRDGLGLVSRNRSCEQQVGRGDPFTAQEFANRASSCAFPAADRFRVRRRFFTAAQSLTRGPGFGGGHAAGARRIERVARRSKLMAVAPSHDQIVRHMVLRDLGVISGVLLHERKPSRFCILDRRRPIMSGNVPVMRGRCRTVAHICQIDGV
jgi:hypothetical protein